MLITCDENMNGACHREESVNDNMNGACRREENVNDRSACRREESVNDVRYLVRSMQPEDFGACAEISAKAIPQEFWKVRDFEAAVKNPQAMLFVAVSVQPENDHLVNDGDGRLVDDIIHSNYEVTGYLVSYFAADEAELDSIAVSNDSRRQGIGRTLMQAYYKKLKEKAVSSIYLEVRESNSTAISFYESEGFESFSKRPHFYDEPVEDAVLMRKRIT